MSQEIIISDLDGTLFGPDHQVSPYTANVLSKLGHAGHPLVVATGRHYLDTNYLKRLFPVHSFITSNGAQVNTASGDLISKKAMDPLLVKSLLHRLTSYSEDLWIHVYTLHTWMSNQIPPEEFSLFSPHSQFPHHSCNLAQLESYEDIIKIFVANAKNEVLEDLEHICQQEFASTMMIARVGPCLEFNDKTSTKGKALIELCKAQSWPLEKTIAFGDNMNDEEMLRVAGKGLIMANAFPRLKERLPDMECIESNGNDGVARYLEQHFLQS